MDVKALRSRILCTLVGGLLSSFAVAECRPEWRHEWVEGAVFYQVFVRSFADSNGDGIGDLPGLTARLDYLNDGDARTTQDLGVDALWLMPVFSSPSYHGYDVTDYESIESDYGTAEDFGRFLEAAHRRGLRVIVDLVMNHTSREHPWFVDAAKGQTARHRAWYVWGPNDPGWTQPWGGDNRVWHRGPDGTFYYGVFWSGMPDLNFDNSEVRAEMLRVARLWLERGVDGFRLDATRHLFAEGPGELQNDRPATHAFLREFAAAIRTVKPDAVVVGENWTDTEKIASYFGDPAQICGGDELPMNFNFPLAEAIIQATRQGRAEPVRELLAAMAASYPAGVLDTPFLTNHDQVRLATQLERQPKRLRSAAAVLLTLPGAPFIYYGEEVGLENAGEAGDPSKRTPMPWNAETGGGFTTGTPWFSFAPGRETANVAAQTGRTDSLLSLYRTLIALRHQHAALRTGTLEIVDGLPSALLGYRRLAPQQKLLVLHNLDATRTLEVKAYLPRRATRLWPAAPAARKTRLAPGETAIWTLR